MKVWSCPRYGGPDVLRLVELPIPVAGPGQILVRVAATSVSSADSRVRGCRFPAGMRLAGRLALGWRGPRRQILGTDCAGVVEDVGHGVERWQAGDDVLVVTGAAMGCHAEWVVAPANGVVLPLPKQMSWAAAVSLPFGGQTARYFLDKAGLAAGQEVLVVGAAGAVGSAAVQMIALAGARAVAVARVQNADWLRDLGAAEVMDYQTIDYAQAPGRFDLVMDCVGAGTFRTLRHLAKPGGAYLAVAGGLVELLSPSAGGVRCVTGYTPESAHGVGDLLDLAGAGKLHPVIGERFPFDRLPDAHTLVDGGHKRGTVVVETGLCPERNGIEVS